MAARKSPHICPILRYADGPAALEFLPRAFGFELVADHRLPDGAVAHADLRIGPSVVGVSSASASPPDTPWSSIRQGVYIRVDDPDAYHARAVREQADVVMPLTDQPYGSREFSLRDPAGHIWGFGTYGMGAGDGEPTVWPIVLYRDAAAAITWLERVIGFSRTVAVPDDTGAIMHAELRLGDAVLMLGGSKPGSQYGDVTHIVNLLSREPDAHCARARAAGATVFQDLHTTSYGARSYGATDPEGFMWWVSDYAPAGAPA